MQGAMIDAESGSENRHIKRAIVPARQTRRSDAIALGDALADSAVG